MSIRVDHPQISVVLKKNVGRAALADGVPTSERFQGTPRRIDLTPFLGEMGAVFVQKAVGAPAGMFSITLTDRMLEQETLYALIEPMDIIEIRMARNVAEYAGLGFERSMPIMMRGFVSDVRRDQGMNGGKPMRSIVINGQDYGKILQMTQIAYLPNEVTGQRLTTYFKFFANYRGDTVQYLEDASTFVRETVAHVVKPFMDDMRRVANQLQGSTESPVLDFQVDATVEAGVVGAFGTNNWPGGTIYDMLTYYGDVGPWNELFVEDREEGVFLVYRPNPFKDAAGKFIQEPYLSDSSTAPATIFVTDEEIINLSTSRSEADVANYYWVNAPRFQLNDGKMIQSAIAHSAVPGLFYLDQYANSSPYIYGFRRMEAQTQQGPRADLLKEADYKKTTSDLFEFTTQKRNILIDQNKDNVVFESGGLQVRGNEQIRPGRTLKMRRGGKLGDPSSGMVSEAYIASVTHHYAPFRQFTTSIQFARGTGFIERAKMSSDVAAPYLQEINAWGLR